MSDQEFNVSYFPNFLFPYDANHYLEALDKVIYPPELQKAFVCGKWWKIPRLQAAFGDGVYRFSGIAMEAQAWNEPLSELREVVECVVGHPLNFALVNYYKDGQDCVGFHQDNERDLVKTAPICSLSLGAERKFVFRRTGHEDHNFALKHGSLLVMNPPTNDFWYHSLPKDPRCTQPRLNITFRQVQSAMTSSRQHQTARQRPENETNSGARSPKCNDLV